MAALIFEVMDPYKQPIEERLAVIVKETAAVHHTTLKVSPFFLDLNRSHTAPHVQRVHLEKGLTVVVHTGRQQSNQGGREGRFVITNQQIGDGKIQGITRVPILV